MDKKTLEEIDFYRIRNEVAGYCLSQEGTSEFLQREPLVDSEQIEKLKNISREWVTYLSTTHSCPFHSWDPVNPLFSIIKTNGASLNLEQVKALGQFVVSVKNVKEAVSLHETDLGLKKLPEQTSLLPDMIETEKKIFRVISPDGEMRDLPEISAIRKQIASLNARIKNIMQSYLGDTKYAQILESNVPVLRNGRQVLAIKASQQNRINGIVHEVSQTAKTVYIEPDEAVRCSNELIQKENELVQVIKRILTDLTLSLQPSIPDLKTALPVMLLLDTTHASARWGLEHECVYAQSCSNFETPFLLHARHPLLGEKAVPVDIRFMDGKRVLIITGPNTGGKTVTLKTFALFSMLNQTGIPLPAAEGTRLPVFTNVFADIGDSQNMDMNLSTFSGHMKNIAQAVEGAAESTLILLDELGSGTDPQEGTAIAMAVLDELIRKNSFVLVTTHMGVLKNYGYTSKSCVNASVEFNTDTLSPSYKLLMGVPGESHALDIAGKAGLNEELVKCAKNYIATEQADVSSLIKGLNKKHVELDKLQHSVMRKENELQEKYDRIREKELNLRRKENELKKGHQQEMHDFLIHSRRQLENLVRQIKEGELTREKTVGVKQFISELEQNVDRLDNKIEVEEEKLTKAEDEFNKELQKRKHPSSNKKTKKKVSNAEALKTASSNFASSDTVDTKTVKNVTVIKELKFEPGAVVVAGSNKNEGTLIKQERKGLWSVQFGSVKMTMKEKDLKLVQKDNSLSNYTPSVSLELASGSAPDGSYYSKGGEKPVFELRLLGLRSEEAIKQLEHQIDLCVLNNFNHFSVIHGKGDGILQQAVRAYLAQCPSVADYEFAPAEDGGAGKTYVTMR